MYKFNRPLQLIMTKELLMMFSESCSLKLITTSLDFPAIRYEKIKYFLWTCKMKKYCLCEFCISYSELELFGKVRTEGKGKRFKQKTKNV